MRDRYGRRPACFCPALITKIKGLCELYNLGWDDISYPERSDADNYFDKVVVCKNKYIKMNTSEKNASYSIVKIVGDSGWGTGFLVKTNHQILCITYNHVLSKSENNCFKAISSYQNFTEFTVIPIKEVIKCDYDNESLKASDEIAVLTPQWDGKYRLTLITLYPLMIFA